MIFIDPSMLNQMMQSRQSGGQPSGQTGPQPSTSFSDYLNARRAEVQGQFAQATGQQAPQQQGLPQRTGAFFGQQGGNLNQQQNVMPLAASQFINAFGPSAPLSREDIEKMQQSKQQMINDQFVNAQQNQMQQFLADQDRYFANQRNTDAQWNQVNQLYQPWTTPQVSPQFPQFPTQDNRAQIPQQPQSPARQSIADEVGTAMAQQEQQQRAEARFRDNNHAGARFIREAMRYNQP